MDTEDEIEDEIKNDLEADNNHDLFISEVCCLPCVSESDPAMTVGSTIVSIVK